MRINTQRLSLLPVSKAHTEDIYTHFTEQIIRYMYPARPKDLTQTAAIVEGFMKQRQTGADLVFAITLAQDGSFIGLAGLHNLRQEKPELGLWIKAQVHGNHYGREAVGGLIAYARGLGLKKLYYPVDRRNIPSKKIPLFYGGRLCAEGIKEQTPDGRILEEEIYVIAL